MAVILTATDVSTAPMRAIVCRTSGRPDHLRLQEIDKPVPADHDIVVRVRASSINPVDFFPLTPVAYRARWLSARGKPEPVVPGTDFAGTVESVGPAVTHFKPGDEVFGGCRGAFAAYLSLSESGPVVHKPANVSFAQAAAVPVAAVTALQAVRDHGRIVAGHKVLINGASGGVGGFALQLAKIFGAEVTAVCSPHNLDTAHSLGADRVIDYTREDFTQRSERYDVLLDVAGSHSWSESTRVLTPRGTYVLVGASTYTVYGGMRVIRHILRARLASLFSRRRFAFFIAKLTKEDLGFLGELLAAGTLKPVIEHEYTLEQVPEAMNRMGEGHVKGKLVISL